MILVSFWQRKGVPKLNQITFIYCSRLKQLKFNGGYFRCNRITIKHRKYGCVFYSHPVTGVFQKNKNKSLLKLYCLLNKHKNISKYIHFNHLHPRTILSACLPKLYLLIVSNTYQNTLFPTVYKVLLTHLSYA